MKGLEDFGFTEEQKEYIKGIMEQRRLKTHKAFFDRYGVKDLGELDSLFGKAKLYDELKEKEKERRFVPSQRSLSNFIGHQKVKKEINKIICLLEKQRRDEMKCCNVFCFMGEPGIGKSAIAELFTKILYDKNLITVSKPEVYCADNLGNDDLKKIYGSDVSKVVVIKDTCSMYGTFFGRERIGFLRSFYSAIDKSKNIITIFCDTKPKLQALLKEEKQLAGRVSSIIDFESYSYEELFNILAISLKKKEYEIGEEAVPELKLVIKHMTKLPEYSNVRSLKVLLEKLLIIQAARTKNAFEDRTITLDDLYQYEEQERITRIMIDEQGKESEKKLNELIGLDSVKKQIKRLKAYALKNLKTSDNINLHMCFTGNQGTGKTEVAKLVAGILYENGILPENKLIERDRSTLIGKYIGQTAPLVREAVCESLGGVLFVDEAYSLFTGDDDSKDYGQEAISELLKCMEEFRGQFAVIFAGYKNETLKMIESNPGLKSRINHYVDFPNYTHDELVEIAKYMLKRDGYKCSESVISKLCKIAEIHKEEDNYGNAREVRNIIESLYEIQAERTINNIDDKRIIVADLDTYIKENNIKLTDKKESEIGENKETLKTLYSLSSEPPVINPSYIEERVVLIKNTKNGKPNGEGTGFLFSETGTIATNNHVVEGSDELIVRKTLFLTSGEKVYKEYKATICKTNKDRDVAVIRITDLDIKTPYFKLSEKLPEVMTSIIMGGYSFGASRLNSISFSEGFVQAINKDTQLIGELKNIERIYVDIKGVPGNSGGAIISKETGEVLGVYSGASIHRQQGVTHEMKFAMPIQYVWDLID